MEATPIEERRLALEERRVVAEENRLNQEIKWGWITRLGVAIPLVILVATLIYNGWEFRRAADENRERDRQQSAEENDRLIGRANVDAQLTLIDVLLSQESPQQAYAAALAIDDLGLGTDVIGEELAPLVELSLDEDAGSKEGFINLLLTYPDDQEAVIALWQRLFPTDDWVDDLR